MTPVGHLPLWQRVEDRLAAHSSVLVHVPRQYGERAFVQRILRADGPGEFVVRVHIHLPRVVGEGGVDYARVWEELKRSLKVRGRSRVDNLHMLVLNLGEYLRKDAAPTLLVVTGAGRSRAEAQYSLLGGLMRLHTETHYARRLPFTLVAVDDYTLFYYENWQRQRASTFDFLDPEYGGPLSMQEVCSFLQRCRIARVGASDAVEGVSDEAVARLTGGHGGLVMEAAEVLFAPGAERGGITEEVLEERLRNGTVVDHVYQALSGNASAFCETALAYEGGGYYHGSVPPENMQYLRQWGVLHFHPYGRVALSGGIIGDMVREIGSSRPPAGAPVMVTTMDRELGFDEIAPKPNDLVVVHLSDLHVGPNFRYYLDMETYRGRKSAAEMLREDLKRMGLIGRIDALVITGDFAEQGSDIAQFSQARQVLRSICEQLEVPAERVAVIAGNHDIDWTPSEFSIQDQVTKVSRDNYNLFCELLQKSSSGATLTEVDSPAAGCRLRIVGLDSNLVEGPQAGGIGYVGRETLRATESLLREDHSEGERRMLTWMAVHHHVFPATSPTEREAYQKKVSLFANSDEVLHHAHDWGVELILHGHEHQPSITVAERWNCPPSLRKSRFSRIVSIGAGSLALSTHTGSIGNHYYVLHRSDGALTVYSRWLDAREIAFTGHDRVRIDMP
jgi:predicted MPP superfamily phosphohydrolase